MAIINTAPTQIATPYMITLTDAGIPTPDSLPDGTLLFYRDSGTGLIDMYQSFLSKNSWEQIGGGGTQDFQGVLTVSSILTSGNTVDCSSNTFLWTEYTTYSIATNSWGFTTDSLAVLLGAFNGTDYCFQIKNDNTFYIGVYLSSFSGGTGLGVDIGNSFFYFGDYGGILNGCSFTIDDDKKETTSTTDVFNIVERTTGAGLIKLDGTGFISATAGANTANHLVVKINGTIYKIQLKAV